MAQLELNHSALKAIIRQPDSHKGSHGSVAVIGGNVGMLGAALLCGRAAMAAGTGKTWLYTLDVRFAVDPNAPELMIRSSDALFVGLKPGDDLDVSSALAVGPGLGQDSRAHAALARALTHHNLPTVFDADALNMLSAKSDYLPHVTGRDSMAVLTPHAGEAGRLLGRKASEIQANRMEASKQIAQHYNSVVVLKGPNTVVYHPSGDYYINQTGGPALAVAGQGDVLSGVIACFLAHGISPFDAACLGTFVHGLAGDLYTKRAGGTIGLSAHAMPELISQVLNQEIAVLLR